MYIHYVHDMYLHVVCKCTPITILLIIPNSNCQYTCMCSVNCESQELSLYSVKWSVTTA